MRWKTLAFAVPLTLAAPAGAAVSDFRLPEAGPQPPPDRQGPVVADVPESRAAPAPTPAPTRAPTPAPTASQPAIVVPDLGEAEPGPRPARTAARPPSAENPSSSLASAPAYAGPESVGDSAPPEATALPAPSTASPADEGTSWWPWALAGLAGLGALGLAGWAWRRRGQPARAVAVQQIDRPRLTPATPAIPAGPAPGEPLDVTLEPLRLSLTLMTATLAYRLQVANRGSKAIAGLAIGADMISAHASLSREEQLSGPARAAATLQRIERLEPGESRVIEGEFRLPFGQIVPIRQGTAALLLPLARFRLAAEGAAPVVRTFVVGQPGANAGLQPFRLDQGPRIFPKLAQRAFEFAA